LIQRYNEGHRPAVGQARTSDPLMSHVADVQVRGARSGCAATRGATSTSGVRHHTPVLLQPA
jgi:hypothetical protein